MDATPQQAGAPKPLPLHGLGVAAEACDDVKHAQASSACPSDTSPAKATSALSAPTVSTELYAAGTAGTADTAVSAGTPAERLGIPTQQSTQKFGNASSDEDVIDLTSD